MNQPLLIGCCVCIFPIARICVFCAELSEGTSIVMPLEQELLENPFRGDDEFADGDELSPQNAEVQAEEEDE